MSGCVELNGTSAHYRLFSAMIKLTENSYSRFGWDPIDEIIEARFFTGQNSFLLPNQQSQNTEGNK